MGIVRCGIPQELTLTLHTIFGIEDFVETGGLRWIFRDFERRGLIDVLIRACDQAPRAGRAADGEPPLLAAPTLEGRGTGRAGAPGRRRPRPRPEARS